MNFITHIFDALTQDHAFGGGGSLDLINAPTKPAIGITPNRAAVFKRYNYKFKSQ